MAQLIVLSPGFTSVVEQGSVSVQISDGTLGQLGGLVMNPLTPKDQGIEYPEPLFINILGPAGTSVNSSTGTISIDPGQKFLVPPGVQVWVNAYTGGHEFTSYFSTSYAPSIATSVPGEPGLHPDGTFGFPPNQVTGLTQTIPSYLYQEYSDDDDLQGFVAAQNQCQDDFVDTFNNLNLPIYPGPVVSGKLLDWVAHGLYGFPRPSLSSGQVIRIGPLNTWGPNYLVPLNEIEQQTPDAIVVTDDDTYRRCLTWHFFKADGKYLDIRWLKRRVWRFCYGANGTAPEVLLDPMGSGQQRSIADTEQISITFGPSRECTIRFVLGKRTVTGGAMLNTFGCNGFGPPSFPTVNKNFVPIPLNDLESTYVPYLPLPYMSIFQEAINSGVLEMPYQFQFQVTIG